jgi:hypothetical protein
LKGLGIVPLRWAQVAWYTYKFQDDRFVHLSNITVITAIILRAVILVLRSKGFIKYTVEMASRGTIYLLGIMNIGGGV